MPNNTIIAVIDFDQLGQALIGLCVFLGVAATAWQNRKRAEEVKLKAEEVAAGVAELAKQEAAAVADKLAAAGVETQKQLQEIHVMVDGRLDAALKKIESLESRLDAEKGDPPGTAAHEAGPAVLREEDKPV